MARRITLISLVTLVAVQLSAVQALGADSPEVRADFNGDGRALRGPILVCATASASSDTERRGRPGDSFVAKRSDAARVSETWETKDLPRKRSPWATWWS